MASLLLPRTFARFSAPSSSLLGLRTASSAARPNSRSYTIAARSIHPQPKSRYHLFALSATTTSLLLVHHTFSQRRPLLCDAPATTRSLFNDYTSEAKTPIVNKEGKPNPSAFRQISGGSIVGLVGGLVVASFSKTLVFLLWLGVLLVQGAASRGINIVPTQRIQRYVKGVDVRSLVEDNVAFKVSFAATTFMLAAFAEF